MLRLSNYITKRFDSYNRTYFNGLLQNIYRLFNHMVNIEIYHNSRRLISCTFDDIDANSVSTKPLLKHIDANNFSLVSYDDHLSYSIKLNCQNNGIFYIIRGLYTDGTIAYDINTQQPRMIKRGNQCTFEMPIRVITAMQNDKNFRLHGLSFEWDCSEFGNHRIYIHNYSEGLRRGKSYFLKSNTIAIREYEHGQVLYDRIIDRQFNWGQFLLDRYIDSTRCESGPI